MLLNIFRNLGALKNYLFWGSGAKALLVTLEARHCGRSISLSSGRDCSASSKSSKIVTAVPKADVQEDAAGGVQKFRVKLLAETYGQTTTDVLCQVMCANSVFFNQSFELFFNQTNLNFASRLVWMASVCLIQVLAGL